MSKATIKAVGFTALAVVIANIGIKWYKSTTLPGSNLF